MAIFNSDGTLYAPTGSMQQFNPGRQDLEFFNKQDSELIKIAGSPIYYYEVLIQPQTIDPIYWEDRGKLFSNNPIELFAVYEPRPSSSASSSFGIDSIGDEILFELNYKDALERLDGKPPKRGSRIWTPHLRENWLIDEIKTGEYKLWGVMRLQIIVSRFQEDLITGDGRVVQKEPDIKVI